MKGYLRKGNAAYLWNERAAEVTPKYRCGGSHPYPEEQPVRQIDPVDRFAAFIVRHVGQIPKEFVRKELELKGTVREILPSGELRVEHIPIVRLPSIFGRKKAPK
ncbi:hypothetical protein ANCCEY_15062, partial [Ancylostoma ceylanicum]